MSENEHGYRNGLSVGDQIRYRAGQGHTLGRIESFLDSTELCNVRNESSGRVIRKRPADLTRVKYPVAPPEVGGGKTEPTPAAWPAAGKDT